MSRVGSQGRQWQATDDSSRRAVEIVASRFQVFPPYLGGPVSSCRAGQRACLPGDGWAFHQGYEVRIVGVQGHQAPCGTKNTAIGCNVAGT